MKYSTLMLIGLLLFSFESRSQKAESHSSSIITGAEQTDLYLPQLKGKRVALVVDKLYIDNQLFRDTKTTPWLFKKLQSSYRRGK